VNKEINNNINFIEEFKSKDKYTLFIYLYIFLMPWNFFKAQMGIFTFILFFWWIAKYRLTIFKKLNFIIQFKPLLLLVIFIFYSYLSVLWSSSFEDGFDHVNKFHKYYIFIMLPLFLSLRSKEALDCIKILLLSIGLYAVFSILIYSGLITIESTKSDISNPKGIMAYAIMSVFMAMGTLMSFFIAKTQKNNYLKILFYIISILSLFALFINNSRTAQITLLLTVSIVFTMYYKQYIFKFKNILKIAITVCLVVFLSFQFLKESNKMSRYISAYNETKEIYSENKYEGSFGLRIYFNMAGFDIFKDEPLFGYGPEDNIEKFVTYQKNDKNYTFIKIYNSFHSQHIDLLTRYGLTGYLLIIFSAIYLIYSLRHFREIYYTALSFFLIVFFSSLANVMLIKKPFNYVYITIFVLFSVIAYHKNKSSINELS